MIQVVIPANLRTLASVGAVVEVKVVGLATQRSVLDALESDHPSLRGTIRDPRTSIRRPMVRFFACQEDHSDDPPDAPLPGPVADGREPFLIVGAMAGG